MTNEIGDSIRQSLSGGGRHGVGTEISLSGTADAKPYDVAYVRRTAKKAIARPAMSWADIAIAVRLAASVPAAWLLPQSAWPSVARGASWLGAKLTGKTTAVVSSRMKRAFGRPTDELSDRLAGDLRGARYEVAFQCLRHYRPGGWHPKVTLEGRGHLDEALRRGRGCVLWVAHFVFAPNIVKLALHDAGFRVSHLSRPDHGFSSTRFGIRTLNPVRSRFEDALLAERIVFDRTHPAPALLRARKTVARNGIVSFTAGAWEGASVVEARFLGSRIALAQGPVWLARATGAVLLPVFGARIRAPDEFTVEVGEPIDVNAAPSERESLVEATRTFLQRHEPYVQKCPGQWRGWSSLQDD
jgi:lauroyl/myristoyl acyltransferase